MGDIEIDAQILNDIIEELKYMKMRLKDINNKKEKNLVDENNIIFENVSKYEKTDADVNYWKIFIKEFEELRDVFDKLDDRELKPEYIEHLKEIEKKSDRISFRSVEELENYFEKL